MWRHTDEYESNGLSPEIPTLRSEALLFSALTFFWFIITLCSYGFEDPSPSGHELRILVLCKILFVLFTWTERNLLFPRRRWPVFRFGLWGMLGVLIFILRLLSPMAGGRPWFTVLLLSLDAIFLSFFLAAAGEITADLVQHWQTLPVVNPSRLFRFWSSFWRDFLCAGYCLFLFFSLGYYYLINFHLVDTLWYSYMLSFLMLALGGGLFLIPVWRIKDRIHIELNRIDTTLADYPLDIPALTSQNTNPATLPAFHTLLLLHAYLKEQAKPIPAWGKIFIFLCLASLLLILPYLFQVTVEVPLLP